MGRKRRLVTFYANGDLVRVRNSVVERVGTHKDHASNYSDPESESTFLDMDIPRYRATSQTDGLSSITLCLPSGLHVKA